MNERYWFEKWLHLAIIPGMWAVVLWLEWKRVPSWYVWVLAAILTMANVRCFIEEHNKPTPGKRLFPEWRLYVAWCGPKDYVFHKWCFDWFWYSFTRGFRLFGLLVQWYKPIMVDRVTAKPACKTQLDGRANLEVGDPV